MRKLSIFIPTLMGGGAERVIVILANEISQRGITVDLVLSRSFGPYLADVHPSVNIVDLRSKRLFFSIIPLVRYIQMEKPKVMLTALNTANIIAIIARIVSRVKFKLVISERAVTSVAIKDNPLIRSKLVPFLMRITYQRADAIVAVSFGVLDDLINKFKITSKNICVVYNPVVSSQLIKLSNEKFDHEWFDNEEVPVILSIGRLTSQKNFPMLINAFSLLLESHRARLVILGKGELQEDLENLVIKLNIREKVSFPGFVTNPFMWMKNASLFVLSSDYEGLPGTLIQAMACGTPVVSTDCPSGPKEILENGQWGRLVPMRDVESLSRAMAATLDEEVHPDVARRAQYFDINHGVEGYMKILGLI
jgi:glycosyltransferase involved in cell wall biosynthesis